MSTSADLPSSAAMLSNPAGNGAYSYSEDAGNRIEEYSWVCNWDDRNAFREVVIGYPETVIVGGMSVTRNITLQSDITPDLYAIGISMKGEGKSNTHGTRPYNKAIFKIKYALPTNGAGADSPYYSISEQGSLRSVTVPNYKNSFSNGEKLDSNYALTFPGTSILLTIFQVNDIVAFRSMAQNMLATPVNSSPITLGGLSVGTGKALFEGYSTDSTISGLGVEQHSGQIVINVSSLPWNSFVRSDGNIDTLNNPPYSTGNLNTLLI